MSDKNSELTKKVHEKATDLRNTADEALDSDKSEDARKAAKDKLFGEFWSLSNHRSINGTSCGDSSCLDLVVKDMEKQNGNWDLKPHIDVKWDDRGRLDNLSLYHRYMGHFTDFVFNHLDYDPSKVN